MLLFHMIFSMPFPRKTYFLSVPNQGYYLELESLLPHLARPFMGLPNLTAGRPSCHIPSPFTWAWGGHWGDFIVHTPVAGFTCASSC